MAITSNFDPATGVLTTTGDDLGNTITTGRDAAGSILVNGGAVPISGGTPTVANTTLIQVFGQGDNDAIAIDESIGAMPAANLFGAGGNDAITGGIAANQLFGQDGNDVLVGGGGADLLFGGENDDTLTGGDGDDQMFGEGGNDRIIWNPGDDTDLVEGGDGNDTAEVNGGNGAEVFTATANGTRVRFDRVTPAPFSLDIGTTENLVLNMNGGDDTFSTSGNLSPLISLTIDGGAGNDTILGGNGADLLLGGDGNDFIDGNQGNDVAFLGAGDDVFQWDPGDGSDTVEGQDGIDGLIFNGANINEHIDIAANGGRLRFFRDVANITMDLNDVESVQFNALGGADNITINDLTGTDATQVTVSLASTIGGATGDAMADTLIVNGSNAGDVVSVAGAGTSLSVSGLQALVNVIASEGANDSLVLNGGGGNDNLSAAGLSAGVTKLTLDGGLGADVLIGSAGADVLIGNDGNDFVDGGRGDDIALLGINDDTFQWDPGDGNDTIEGQGGLDRLNFNGANINENIDIAANGSRVRFFRDVANVTMDLNSVETIQFRALGGADNIVINDLTGTDVPFGGVHVDLAGSGGLGDGATDRVTIIGTAGNENISVFLSAGIISVTGGTAPVTIAHAESGDQLVINGTAGNDIMDAGTLAAGAIALTLDGGLGNDFLNGGIGPNTLQGGANDDVYGVDNPGDAVIELVGEGNDTILSTTSLSLAANVENLVLQGSADLQGYGNSLGNQLYGNAGGNLLDGGTGADLMVGAAGNDIYFVDDIGDVVTENPNEGNDTIFSAASLNLGVNVENLVLQGGADLQGYGNALINQLYGNTGNNILDGGAGGDAMFGGAGNDFYFVDNISDIVIENASEGSDTIFSTVNITLPSNVEFLTLQGTADLQGYGNGLQNQLFGNSGGNILDGGAGVDSMSGGAGNDFYFVDNTGDVINENAGEGNDTVFTTANYTLSPNIEVLVLQGTANLQGFGNAQANTLFGNSGNNILDGMGGADTMNGGSGDDTYFVDNASDAPMENAGGGFDSVNSSISFTLGANLEVLTLLGGADLQGFGNASNNVIQGNSGNNVLDGQAGADAMIGGAGNDAYLVDNIGDVVTEGVGAGSDTVYSTINLTLGANTEFLVLQSSADLQGYGNTLNNAIYGNSGSNILDGGVGGDALYGGAGNDFYVVDNISDLIIENAAEGTDTVNGTVNFTLSANVETLLLQGSADLQGFGNAGANTIFGNSGSNLIDGGGSADTLQGFGGNDVFLFRAGEANGDTVVDFTGNGAAAGDSLQFVGYGVGATFTQIDSAHWQVNYNGGLSHDVITFNNLPAIAASDFAFV